MKMRKQGLLALLATLKPREEDFPPIEDLPPEPFEISGQRRKRGKS